MAKKFDIVIFGASGYTGEYVVEEVALSVKNKTWAVAGRSQQKLTDTLKKVSSLSVVDQTVSRFLKYRQCGLDISHIPTIIADVSNVDSLNEMAKAAKIVINCVGPFQLYGEAVVKACIENGANHVDISGEPTYLESMQLKYNDEAKKAGVYIIGACGWDSIPIEAGLNLARKAIEPGELNAVETVTGFENGSGAHSGTFLSMIHGVGIGRKELPPIRKQLFKERLPRTPYKLPKRHTLFYHDGVQGWCLPFLGSDKSVAVRSQYYNFQNRQQRPFLLNTYLRLSSLPMAIGLLIWGICFGILCQFDFTRKLMATYPKIFTFGFFSYEGIPRDELRKTSFSYWIFANGWSEKLANPEEVHQTPPDREVICRVDGPDPGYFATSALVVAAALTVLDDAEKLPPNGGVLPPGAAFAETDLIERLNKRGVVTVKVIKESAII